MDEAVEELHEIKEFLENPKKFQALGARIPKGVLLYGPPGTGKRSSRAVAGEAGVPFFSISGSDFVEMFVGVGASRVRDLFEQAKQASPCIVFMDEIDAVGRHRGAGLGGGHDEREQTLNQLLVEMDGFELKDNIILIAATNRPDILDPRSAPGPLRPADRRRPTRPGRPEKILEVRRRASRSRRRSTSTPWRPGRPASREPIANLVDEAALLAARAAEDDRAGGARGRRPRVADPEKKTRLLSEEERKVTAYHEMGHASSATTSTRTPTSTRSRSSRGQAVRLHDLAPRDRYLTRKSTLMDQLARALGGRAAEESSSTRSRRARRTTSRRSRAPRSR